MTCKINLFQAAQLNLSRAEAMIRGKRAVAEAVANAIRKANPGVRVEILHACGRIFHDGIQLAEILKWHEAPPATVAATVASAEWAGPAAVPVDDSHPCGGCCRELPPDAGNVCEDCDVDVELLEPDDDDLDLDDDDIEDDDDGSEEDATVAGDDDIDLSTLPSAEEAAVWLEGVKASYAEVVEVLDDVNIDADELTVIESRLDAETLSISHTKIRQMVAGCRDALVLRRKIKRTGEEMVNAGKLIVALVKALEEEKAKAAEPRRGEHLTLGELIRDAHETARVKGWWDKPATFGDRIALIHSEASEALEEYRKFGLSELLYYGDPVAGPHPCAKPPYKPEGIAAELADIVIRVADMAGGLDIPLVKAIEAKLAYNRSRTYRHGGKKI